MTLLKWIDEQDWENNQSSDGVVSEEIENTDHNDKNSVKRGYDIDDPTPSDPYLYWPMHEDSGDVVNDFSGNDRNGFTETESTENGLFNTSSYSFTTTTQTWGPRPETIKASGGTETTITIDGQDFIQHEFTGNSNYTFTVDSKGATDGLVWYQIVSDGSTKQDDGGNSRLGSLQGSVLRDINPFTDSNTIFEYTSKQSVSDLGFSHDGGVDVTDTTVQARAEVAGSCRTNKTFTQGFDLHCSSGGRMPTLEEYLNDCTRGSGCGHDGEINWTSGKDVNNPDTKRWVSWGDMNNNSSSIYPRDETQGHELRNIADENLNRPDPVVVQDDDALNIAQNYNYPVNIVDGPKVTTGTTYDLTLGSGASDAIPHTGKQQSAALSGIENKGTVRIRYKAR